MSSVHMPPHMGCEMEYKEDFWSELDEVVESVSKDERVVIGADFSGGERQKERWQRPRKRHMTSCMRRLLPTPKILFGGEKGRD